MMNESYWLGIWHKRNMEQIIPKNREKDYVLNTFGQVISLVISLVRQCKMSCCFHWIINLINKQYNHLMILPMILLPSQMFPSSSKV